MTEEEKKESLERLAYESAMNMGAAKDIFVPDYGWILLDGNLTDIGVKWYEEVYQKSEKK